MKCSYISTRSTLTPHGSVASSNVCSITWLMVSRSERISARCLVPRTFLKVVAANRWVEWLEMTKKKLPIDTIANRVRHSKKKACTHWWSKIKNLAHIVGLCCLCYGQPMWNGISELIQNKWSKPKKITFWYKNILLELEQKINENKNYCKLHYWPNKILYWIGDKKRQKKSFWTSVLLAAHFLH